MNTNTMPRRRPEIAGDDVLRAVEAEFASHALFGDTRSILDRKHALSLLQLEAVSRGRPLIQELCLELRQERNRRAAVDVLKDPVVTTGIADLLRGGGERFPSDEIEAVFAAVLHHLRNGTPGMPVAVGCAVHFRPNDSTHPIALWDPSAPESPVKRRFDFLIQTLCSDYFSRRGAILERPEPAFAKSLERGYDLLSIILPELSASVLAHTRLLGVFTWGSASGSGSATNRGIPSTMFLANVSATPWETAALLLHEALHNKLTDIAAPRSIIRPAGECGPQKIRAIWHTDHPRTNENWTIRRAYYAFHVYVHMTLFFARIERLEASPPADFGAPPTDFERRLEKALGRAGYLGEELTVHADRYFTRDGEILFAWLQDLLSRICDPEALRAHVERLREQAGPEPRDIA